MKKKMCALLCALAIVLTLLPGGAFAATKIGTVVVSVEAFTIGCGYIVEPTLVDLYDGDTAAVVLDRLLDAKGIDYGCTGNLTDSFYLGKIKYKPSAVNPPQFILNALGDNFDPTDNDDDYLGEFDYCSSSGFMICVNNWYINVGASGVSTGKDDELKLSSGDVIRWQYTLYGFGADIGADNTDWGTASLVTVANRDSAYYDYANLSPTWKNANKTKCDSALSVFANLQATDAQICSAASNIASGRNGNGRIFYSRSLMASGCSIELSTSTASVAANSTVSVEATYLDSTKRVSELYANGAPLPETNERGIFTLKMPKGSVLLEPEFVDSATLNKLESGDLDVNSVVNGADLSVLLANFGLSVKRNGGDIDNNNNVDGADLAVLLSNFGI